jgi:hypothetical protein
LKPGILFFFPNLANGLSAAINESKKTLSELLSYEELSGTRDLCKEYTYDQGPNWDLKEINKCKEKVVLSQKMIAKKSLIYSTNTSSANDPDGIKIRHIKIESINHPNKYLMQIRSGHNVLGFFHSQEFAKFINIRSDLIINDQIILELVNTDDIKKLQPDFSEYSVLIDSAKLTLLRSKNNTPIGINMSLWN